MPHPLDLIYQSQRCRPWLMRTVLLTGDIFCVFIGAFAAVTLKLLPHQWDSWHFYSKYIVFVPVFPLVYAMLGLYAGISGGLTEEMRRLTLSTSVLYLVFGEVTVFTRGTHRLFTLGMGLALMITVILLPLLRAFLRKRFAGCEWWGHPVIVFGDLSKGLQVVDALFASPSTGLKPIAVCTSPQSAAFGLSRFPIFNHTELDSLAPEFHGAFRGMVITTGQADSVWLECFDRYRRYFSHVILATDRTGLMKSSVNPSKLGELLDLQPFPIMIPRHQQHIKRALDIVVSLVALLVLSPLMILICLAIVCDSPGPMLYGQRRLGRGGREFLACKFRSMVVNADRVLEDYLVTNPLLQEEWLLTHKLKRDPRITRAGRLLRRTSMDELPQLWNVLCGEMSLVGPRPIVQSEVTRYGGDYEVYTSVHSGLTGLWQVSGRSNTSYTERVAYDRFYVSNWSLWLDVWILFRTIAVILTRQGAV